MNWQSLSNSSPFRGPVKPLPLPCRAFGCRRWWGFPWAFLRPRFASACALESRLTIWCRRRWPKPFATLDFIFDRGWARLTKEMDSKKLALECRELADNRKAEEIVVLDVADLSSIADYFVIASGTSEPHLRAISDEITEKLREQHGVRPRAVDGTLQAGWLVLDYFDVIVHVMRADVRQHYDLEGLWGDAPR